MSKAAPPEKVQLLSTHSRQRIVNCVLPTTLLIEKTTWPELEGRAITVEVCKVADRVIVVVQPVEQVRGKRQRPKVKSCLRSETRMAG
jgi:hypothetical protein